MLLTIISVALAITITVKMNKESSPVGGEDNIAFKKALYRENRDVFRNNPIALEELDQWKAQNNNYDYTVL